MQTPLTFAFLASHIDRSTNPKMPTTEIATLTLTPGSDIGDPNNDASRVVNECGNVLAKQPGLKTLKFGPVVEDASKMQMFIGIPPKPDQTVSTPSH